MDREVNTSNTSGPVFDPRLFLRDEELERGIGLILAAERVLAMVAETARRKTGLSAAECRILLALRTQPGQEISALRARLGATTPTFARQLGRLDAAGYIAKTRGMMDARTRRLSLSTKGAAITEPIAAAMRDAMRRAYRDAGAEKVAGALAVLKAIEP